MGISFKSTFFTSNSFLLYYDAPFYDFLSNVVQLAHFPICMAKKTPFAPPSLVGSYNYARVSTYGVPPGPLGFLRKTNQYKIIKLGLN